MKKLLFISIFIAFAALINAQTITPGMSGLQLRNAVNAKTSALSDSLLTAFDSITAQRGRIALGLLKSDTAAMLDNYTRNGELLSRLNNYLLKSDTTSMLDNYARNGEVINRLGNYLLKSDTASMLGNYTRNSELNAGLATKQNTLVSGTNIKTINSQSLLGSGNITISGGGGGDMVYPGAGIPTSTGSAWGSSITNNSANWNTAYNWGNHANAGYFVGTNSTIRGLFSSSATGLSYNNSTGVFSLTSGYGIPTTTNISNWNTAYGWGNHASAGYRTAAQVGAQIHDTIAGGVALSSVAVMIADTANMLAHYLRKCDAGSGGLTSAQVATQIGDTISARLAAAVPGLRLRDSTGNATGNYMTRAGTTALVNTREAALGNPPADGYFVTSTAAGVRGWAAPSGGMVYPSGSGIPIVNNGAWGTTITNNSTNWNTAYGWGNHASAGYFVGTNATIRQLFSESVTGLTYTDSTGVLSLTSGYLIPTTTQASAWNDAATNFRSATQVATQIGDTIAERLRTAVPGLRLRDSTGNATGNYMTRAGTTTMVNTREAALGNPSTNGYILSSTTAGVRSWIAPPSGGSMVYPSGSGIPIVNNGAWGTTITDNSANWNSAYGWGNHASAGYRNASQVGGQIRDSLIVAKNEDSDTGPLFIFDLGSGHISDTALFNNGRIAGAFYNSGSDTLYVTELRGVLVEGTGTETIAVQVSWDVNMKDETPTNLNTAALTVTSMTTGTSDTTFDNNGIPPGVWVWCTLSGASANNKPTMLSLTMTGYRRNRSN